jgi:hypothetical protein
LNAFKTSMGGKGLLVKLFLNRFKSDSRLGAGTEAPSHECERRTDECVRPTRYTLLSWRLARTLGRALNRLGGCGQDNVVGLSRTQFLADVGFKLRECELRLRRKIFSAAENRRRVVVTARRILAIGKRYRD